MLYAVAVFAPLFGSVVAGFLGPKIGDRPSQAVTIICMVIAAICGTLSFLPVLHGSAVPGQLSLGTWIDVEGFHAEWTLRYDTLVGPDGGDGHVRGDADPCVQRRVYEP